MAEETARALRQRLLVVPFAVALVLLTAVRPPGRHAGLLEEGCADASSANELKELLGLERRYSGVIAGPLADRVAKRLNGFAQAGQYGPSGITAKFPGVTSSAPRRPLWDTIRRDVVQLIEGRVGDFAVLQRVESEDVAPPGVFQRRGGRRRRRRGTSGR